MSRLLKAVNKINQVPKNQEDSRSPAHPRNGQKKIKRHASVDSEAWVFQKKQSSRLFPHIGSLISSTKDIFPPSPRRRCAGPSPVRTFRWETSVVRPASRVTTERGRRRNAGTTREGRIDKKKSFIVRSCFATPKRASERPLDGHSRGSHREPATTGVIITHHRESPRESHAPRGSDGVTKGLSLCSRGRSRDTMHAKVEYKRIESNRSSLGRARGGLTTTTARMFPSWTDGRTDGTARHATGSNVA